MRRAWLIAIAALSVFGSPMSARRAAADDIDRSQAGRSETAFPTYSREDETKVCLLGYGMENSSILDCVARDNNYKSALLKIWPDIDDRYKRDCVVHLADHHLNSYFHLDRCIRASEHDATASD